ncbi:uncharacterized protein TEOVI_000698100 [Trypanosoma equiperdum]|uniref:Uncharacterized protein n=1 Tax=Trypanosoma equiperdum TaxID=5694 RepID=A0A1G4I7S5_TRYEQ|nr:hypothetical protein, conserved [Trypanosoma equiperdum]
MWGGVKVRAHHRDIFRAWSASQNLETLRRQLYREPRPWYMAFKLHQHRHLLSDYHCARLLSWCTAVVQLERRPVPKRKAYMYAQHVFQFMVHSHKVGKESYQEFFRLCALGRDVTAAFRWQQYLVEAGQSFPLSHYTWLLHIAAASPSDEITEDMTEGVWEAYLGRYCSPVKNDVTGQTAMAHFQPTTSEEQQELEGLFAAFKALKLRIEPTAKPELLQFIDNLPNTPQVVPGATSWPTVSRHTIFPHMEAAVPWEAPTLVQPRLRDSLLHPSFVADLERTAWTGDVKGVVALVNEYRQRITAEKEQTSATKHRSGERDIWRHYADPAAVAFRRVLVEEGGVTAELYHYLIVALSATQPSLALRTLRRMENAKLRVLDLTRAVMIVRSEGSSEEQLNLLKEGLKSIEERCKIDEDYDVTREVELYWKFNYAEFFHYRNALNGVELYRILMEGLGPVRVQELLVGAKGAVSYPSEDVVVFDEVFRIAVARHYRNCTGEAEVERALNEITQHMPKLDISLVGSCQHFDGYALPPSDAVATDITSLARKLLGYHTIYLLDSSFVESSEAFLGLGSLNEEENGGHSLVLVPYCCLRQISSVLDAPDGEVVSYDEALQEVGKEDQFIASQRLRSLYALLLNDKGNVKRRVLHFSECLLSQIVTGAVDSAGSDNDHLLLVLAMVRAIAPKETNVVLCTDDAHLVQRLRHDEVASLFAGQVNVLSSEPPEGAVIGEGGLVDDNPNLCVGLDFEPKLNFPAAPRRVTGAGEGSVKAADSAHLHTLCGEEVREGGVSWLDMLGDDEDSGKNSEGSVSALLPVNLTENEEKSAQDQMKLMDMYESEHSVVPIGVRMAEASTLGSLFEQFDAVNPDAALEREAAAAAAAAASRKEPGEAHKKHRRLAPLELEQLRNRGASNKQRYRLARRLSNLAGGRVPFNFRYKVVEVDITDERNKTYRDAYSNAVAKKREAFKRHLQR